MSKFCYYAIFNSSAHSEFSKNQWKRINFEEEEENEQSLIFLKFGNVFYKQEITIRCMDNLSMYCSNFYFYYKNVNNENELLTI